MSVTLSNASLPALPPTTITATTVHSVPATAISATTRLTIAPSVHQGGILTLSHVPVKQPVPATTMAMTKHKLVSLVYSPVKHAIMPTFAPPAPPAFSIPNNASQPVPPVVYSTAQRTSALNAPITASPAQLPPPSAFPAPLVTTSPITHASPPVPTVTTVTTTQMPATPAFLPATTAPQIPLAYPVSTTITFSTTNVSLSALSLTTQTMTPTNASHATSPFALRAPRTPITASPVQLGPSSTNWFASLPVQPQPTPTP